MGICYSTTCLDCKVDSPIDWSGLFGAPSLSAERVATGRYEILPFGYLYAPFVALGIRPYELEAFEGFLRGHEGHRLCQWSDADSEIPTELASILASREGAVGSVRRELEEAQRLRAASVANGTYVFGRYVIRCPACAVDLRCPESECLLARQRSPLTAAAIAFYLTFASQFDPEDTSRPPFHVDCAAGFVDDLEAFLKVHGAHGVEAWVEPGAA